MTQSPTATKSAQINKQSSFLATPGFSLFLKMLQTLCLAALLFCAIATFVIPEQSNRFILYDAGLLAGLFFLFIFGSQIADFAKGGQIDLNRKAGIYANLLSKNDVADDSPDRFVDSRKKALEYCQELIYDYKKIRKNSRNYYYVFQISTIILSGVTPILVLLDKQETIPYLRWLPVIFPALAAIVTSVATSFPFQERWVNANRVVEKLEAEQEKFVLGITEPYRVFTLEEEDDQMNNKIKFSIENFIIEVNKIHLQQVEVTPTKAAKETKQPAGDRK